MNERWHIYFFGRVQGVGFRMTCRDLASHHPLTGWVRNLSDGSVEMIVEGTSHAIRNYVDNVCDSTYGRVDDRQITKSDATGEFETFEIRR